MKTYTIIAGVNGVGKSSLTGVLRTEITNLGKIIDVYKIIAKCNGNMIEGGKKSIELIDDCLDREICFTQEATFYDNENGFVAVAEYKNGEIMQIGSLKPQWLAELMEYVI